MQYMLMCCFDEDAWEKVPEAEQHTIMREYGEWVQSLVKNGRFRGGGQLHPTSAATTIRMKQGKTILTDGPFAETKEQFGGYHLVECANLDEAIAIAMHIPTLPAGGAIEVRPLAMIEGQPL
jgi:hypothetical protein